MKDFLLNIGKNGHLINLSIYLSRHTCMYASTHIIYIHVHVYMHICIHVCRQTHMDICVYVSILSYITEISMYAHIYVFSIHMYTDMFIYTYMYACIYEIYVCMSIICVFMYKFTYIHTHTCLPMSMNPYVHTFTCMHICHRLEIWDMELTRQFMHNCRKQSVGMLVGMQVNWCGSPVHVQCFSCQNRETHNHDII